MHRLRHLLEVETMSATADLDPAWVASQTSVDLAHVQAILNQLSAEGLVEQAADGRFRVAATRPGRNLSARIAPTLIAMAQLAATAASEADIAGLLAARNRMDSAIAALDAPARAEAYRDVITRIAAATGNSFYQLAAAQLLNETRSMIDALTTIDLQIYTADSRGGEMLRMVEAIAARNPALAAEAAQDHALIITLRLDQLAVSASG